MDQHRKTQKPAQPAQHALRLDLPSIAQSGLALVLACTIAYFINA